MIVLIFNLKMIHVLGKGKYYFFLQHFLSQKPALYQIYALYKISNELKLLTVTLWLPLAFCWNYVLFYYLIRISLIGQNYSINLYGLVHVCIIFCGLVAYFEFNKHFEGICFSKLKLRQCHAYFCLLNMNSWQAIVVK